MENAIIKIKNIFSWKNIRGVKFKDGIENLKHQ